MRFLLPLLLMIFLLACSKKDSAIQPSAPQLSSISLNCLSAGIKIGENHQMSVTTAPSNFDINGKISWKSSNETVAQVDATGKVTMLSEGNVNITATYSPNPTIAISCQISVIPVTASSIKLSEATVNLFTGDSKKLTYQIEPNNTTDKTVFWSSENPSTATVDQTGNITAVAPGQTKIFIKTANNTIQASCDITVESIKPTSLTLNRSSLSGIIGQSDVLIATIAPSNTTYKNITWKSSDENIATIDANGEITFIDFGKATITASTQEGNINASALISVEVNQIQIEGNTLLKIKDETVSVSAFYINGKNIRKVIDDAKFEIDNTNIANLVNYSNGTADITFKNAGSAILTASSNKYSKTKTQVIQVVEISQFVKANSSFTIGQGDSYDSGTGMFTGKYTPNITNSAVKPVELISCGVYQTGGQSPIITFDLTGVILQPNHSLSVTTMQYNRVYKPYAVFTYRYASKIYTAEIRNFY